LIKGALKAASISEQVLLVLETMGTEDGMTRSIETALDHQVDAIIIAAMLPYLVAFALPRFHLPVIPLVMPIAALALDRVLEAPRESMRTLLRSPLWWGMVIVVLALQVEHFYHLARLQ
jgi:DNA-binding LacI/PurR family transcriptional regulator